MCFGLTNMEFNCGTLSSSLHYVVLLCYLFSTSSILGVSPYCSGELPGMHVAFTLHVHGNHGDLYTLQRLRLQKRTS